MSNNSTLDGEGVELVESTTVVYNKSDVMDSVLLRTLFISAYAVVFVLGVAGNTLVVYVVWSNPSMRSITNVFIANLAASDIMMCLLAVPFTPISGLLKAWPFGDLLCHLVPMTLGVSVYVSTLTSTAIAVDRYFVIVHPFRPRMHVVACVVLIVAIWLVSVSISLPLALYQEVNLEGEFYVCHEHWPGPASRQFFTVVSLALQYIVPCLIITYCYARVSAALRRRACAKIGTGSGSVANRRQPSQRGEHLEMNGNRSVVAIDDDDDRVTCTTGMATSTMGGACASVELRNRIKLRRKRRTNRMLIAMVAIFVICWMPLNIIILTLEYYDELGNKSYFLLLFFVAHVIAMSSTVYNPFLYAWMNDNFRKEFRRVLPCLRWSPRRSGAATICGRRLNFRFSLTSDGGVMRGGGGDGSPSYYSTVGYGLTDPTACHQQTVLRLSRRQRNAGNNDHVTTPPVTAAAGSRRVMYNVGQQDVCIDCSSGGGGGGGAGRHLPTVEQDTEQQQRLRVSSGDRDDDLALLKKQQLLQQQADEDEPEADEDNRLVAAV
jgi:neuropeptide Y receptor